MASDSSDKPRVSPVEPGTRLELAELEARIQAARGRISPLYKVLLNSPALASGWEQLLSAVRQHTTVPPRLRELVILRVAALNGAEYEFDAHVAHARAAGVSDAKLQSVREDDLSGFEAREQLVLLYADAMTRDLTVPDALYAQLDAAFDARTLVELTATIAAYNMVSRFLIALRIH